MSLSSNIESILFVASKPLSAKKIAGVLKINENEALLVLEGLASEYNTQESGIVVLRNNDEWRMAANPANMDVAENFLKAEISGELTRQQLETLTAVAYCGPITKPELEQIRGVNCGIILRNLMMRGLIKEAEDPANLLPTYEVTMDFVRHLGVNKLSDLPEYAELHKHEYIVRTKDGGAD